MYTVLLRRVLAATALIVTSGVLVSGVARSESLTEANEDFTDQYEERRIDSDEHYWAPVDGHSESEKDFEAFGSSDIAYEGP